jgi:hypothetical protein
LLVSPHMTLCKPLRRAQSGPAKWTGGQRLPGDSALASYERAAALDSSFALAQ